MWGGVICGRSKGAVNARGATLRSLIRRSAEGESPRMKFRTERGVTRHRAWGLASQQSCRRDVEFY